MCNDIRDCEPSTSCVKRNVYHMHLPLYVLDVVRTFQDHPKYAAGIKECDIIAMLEKEPFACGDLEAQVKTALIDLSSKGFLRYINHGYRTLGPIAKLANARTPRQFNMAWDRLNELQKVSCTSLNSSSSTRSANC